MNFKKLLTVLLGILVLTGSRPQALDLRNRLEMILHKEELSLDGETKSQIVTSVMENADRYQIDPLLILAIIKVESHFKPVARSGRGAIGLMQVKPIAAREVGMEKELAKPETNIRVGVHYLSTLLTRFKGDLHKAIVAYNRGPTYVVHYYRAHPSYSYLNKVLRTYQDLSSS